MQKSDQSCVVLLRPRLHLTLIGMNADGYRRNGGVGFSISQPCAEISVSRSEQFHIEDTRQYRLQPEEILRITEIIRNFSTSPVHVRISGEMPSHYGFGSATAIRLGVIEAIGNLQSRTLGREQLVRDSGRGGTSGIGVSTYFDGGLIFDVGIQSVEDSFAPSSSVEGKRPPPLVLSRFPMPDWKVGICIPNTLQPQTAQQETAFFNKICPVAATSVHETLYHVTYGLVASAREQNLQTFGKAIRAIQNCPWKRGERELYGEELLKTERSIYEAGASAVGLSSLGPGLFFIADALDVVVADLRARHPQHSWYASTCWNSGRTISSE